MLHITGIRDNYHELQSIFGFSSDIYDVLKFNPKKSFSNHSAYIKGIHKDDNLIHKTRDFLVNILGNISIPDLEIKKNIPEGSGLGGGSSDAATFILQVLELNNIPKKEMIDIAKESYRLGMDVPLFFYRNLFNINFVLLEGLGKFEEIKAISTDDKFKISIFPINPHIPLSTRLVFDKFDQAPAFEKKHVFNESFSLELLKEQKNSLQKFAIELCPSIENTINSIEKTKACISRMSGSGSACFGLYQI